MYVHKEQGVCVIQNAGISFGFHTLVDTHTHSLTHILFLGTNNSVCLDKENVRNYVRNYITDNALISDHINHRFEETNTCLFLNISINAFFISYIDEQVQLYIVMDKV